MSAAATHFEVTSTCRGPGTCARPEMTVISAQGEIDAATSRRFTETMNLAADCAEGSLLVDLTEVEFIDGKGYEAVLDAERRMGERGGEVLIVCDHSAVRRIFTLLNPRGRLRMCP
jgi:anti-sigma B factor antagonist